MGIDLQTLASSGRIGLYAFLFGAVAWAIVRIRQVFFRDHAITQTVVTLVFALGVELSVELYREWWLSAGSMGGGAWWMATLTALYTALWARVLHWPLMHVVRWTGLNPPRRMAPAGMRSNGKRR